MKKIILFWLLIVVILMLIILLAGKQADASLRLQTPAVVELDAGPATYTRVPIWYPGDPPGSPTCYGFILTEFDGQAAAPTMDVECR